MGLSQPRCLPLQLIMGPAVDGGYYLMGVTAAGLSPALFQVSVDWAGHP